MLAQSSPIAVTVAEDLGALHARKEEWNALAERAATSTIFQTFEWNQSWWRTLAGAARPLVLLAQSGGELVGIAPLVVVERRILGRRRRVIEFLGTHAADFSDFIVEPTRRDVAALLLDWLVRNAARWDLLDLVNIAETSPLLEILPRAFAGTGRSAQVRRLYECPTRVLSHPEADARLINHKRFRKKMDRLRREGPLEFGRYGGEAEMQAALPELFRMHNERWAGTGRQGFFFDEGQRAFYADLVRGLGPKGWLLFSSLTSDGKPIALHFGFDYRGRMYYIKTAHDPAFRTYSPSLVHLRYLLEHASERGACEFDFGVGEEAYKYAFANKARVNYAARVHSPALFYGLDRVLAGAKAVLKRSPAAAQLARRLVKPFAPTLQRLGL